MYISKHKGMYVCIVLRCVLCVAHFIIIDVRSLPATDSGRCTPWFTQPVRFSVCVGCM